MGRPKRIDLGGDSLETVPDRLCYDPLHLHNHQVVNDNFKEHFHLSSHCGSCSQVAAEVSFDHADGGFCLSALAVGFAFLRALEFALHVASVSVTWGFTCGPADLGFDP